MDESNKSDLGKTRKARMTVDIICKLDLGRTGKARMTVDKACKFNLGRTEKARITVDKACKFDPDRTGKANKTVDKIHKPPLGSAKHETIRIISLYRLATIFPGKESNSKQRP